MGCEMPNKDYPNSVSSADYYYCHIFYFFNHPLNYNSIYFNFLILSFIVIRIELRIRVQDLF